MDAYLRFRKENPEMFANDPEGIRILEDAEEVAEAEQAVGLKAGVVYSDKYIVVLRDPVVFPGGKLGMYLRIVPPVPEVGTVILPLLDGSVVLVEHYRHATRSWHIEVPRGFGTSGISPDTNAAKEMAEEIGAGVTEMIPLGKMYPDSGLMAAGVLLFAAKINRIGLVEKSEGIRRAFTVSVAELERMIRSGDISDGFTIAAYTRARLAGLFD